MHDLFPDSTFDTIDCSLSGRDKSDHPVEMGRREWIAASLAAVLTTRSAGAESVDMPEIISSLKDWYKKSPEINAILAELSSVNLLFHRINAPTDRGKAQTQGLKSLRASLALLYPFPKPIADSIKNPDISREFREWVKVSLEEYERMVHMRPHSFPSGVVPGHILLEYHNATHPLLNFQCDPEAEEALAKILMKIDPDDERNGKRCHRSQWKVLAELFHRASVTPELPKTLRRYDTGAVPESLLLRKMWGAEQETMRHTGFPEGISVLGKKLCICPKTGNPLMDEETKEPLFKEVSQNFPLAQWNVALDQIKRFPTLHPQ